MTQNVRRIAGPLAFSIGGRIAGLPVFAFFYLLHYDRFAGSDADFQAFLLLALFMLFAGLWVASIGI